VESFCSALAALFAFAFVRTSYAELILLTLTLFLPQKSYLLTTFGREVQNLFILFIFHSLETLLQVNVSENWTKFGVEALQYSLDKLALGENEHGWWTYFPIHKKDNKLIGSGGYKGQPNSEGIVELGYEIAAEYRKRSSNRIDQGFDSQCFCLEGSSFYYCTYARRRECLYKNFDEMWLY